MKKNTSLLAKVSDKIQQAIFDIAVTATVCLFVVEAFAEEKFGLKLLSRIQDKKS